MRKSLQPIQYENPRLQCLAGAFLSSCQDVVEGPSSAHGPTSPTRFSMQSTRATSATSKTRCHCRDEQFSVRNRIQFQSDPCCHFGLNFHTASTIFTG